MMSFGPLPGSWRRRPASGAELQTLQLLWQSVVHRLHRLPPAYGACRRPSRRLQLPAKQTGWHLRMFAVPDGMESVRHPHATA